MQKNLIICDEIKQEIADGSLLFFNIILLINLSPYKYYLYYLHRVHNFRFVHILISYIMILLLGYLSLFDPDHITCFFKGDTMFIRLFYSIIILVVVCTSCSAKNQIRVEQQSSVRWHEKESILEVYVAVANTTKQDVSFGASIVMLNPNLKDAVGFVTKQLETDDRNGKTPFRLAPYNETVFKRNYKTNRSLSLEMLSKGVGIKISTLESSYIIPINYGEIE
jgi:hypothetical protein